MPVPWKGWSKESPNRIQRKKMLKCGNCFLGKGKYPICVKNTCRRSRKGIYAAFVRARQQKSRRIALKAKRLLGIP